MSSSPSSRSHRGTLANPPNRFEPLHLEPDPDAEPEEQPLPRTVFLKDNSCTIISYNESPDVGVDATINPYRGCEHGCIYCYARPYHEYLGFSSGLDFESKILVKLNAAALLRQELTSPKWRPRVLGLSGVTDCYQPVERRLKLTRACLEVLTEFRNPVNIVTKNELVTRDIDLLRTLAQVHAVSVCISVTSLDPKLRGFLEPRTSPPASRLKAVTVLARAGIPTGVLVAPIIPGLTDHEVPKILKAAADAGASFAGYEVLRLPHSVSDLFEQWLQAHFPDNKEKVLNQIRAIRGGKLNDPRFGSRMRGEGHLAEQLSRMFDVARRRAGIRKDCAELSTASFRRPDGLQLQMDFR